MGLVMANDSSETKDLLHRAEQGDKHALGQLFGLHQDRLRRMVLLRLDRRLQGRIDPSGVLQETYLDSPIRRCLSFFGCG